MSAVGCTKSNLNGLNAQDEPDDKDQDGHEQGQSDGVEPEQGAIMVLGDGNLGSRFGKDDGRLR